MPDETQTQPEHVLTPEEWDAVRWSLEVGEREIREQLDLGWTPTLGKRNNAIVSAIQKIKET